MQSVVSRALAASILAVALAASGAASAQSYGEPHGSQYGSQYGEPVVDGAVPADGGYDDYARVVRVVPVVGAPQGYPAQDQRCTTRRDGYAGDYYGSDGYHEPGEMPRSSGTQGGRTMSSVVGSVLGAVIGSQIGGGSARYATAAIGSAVGGIAGRQAYENAHSGEGAVTVCDPVDARRPYAGGPYAGNTGLYDVTYEYGGRSYVTRTAYNPGDRIRVRVDVRPE